MANTRSAKKMVRKIERRTAVNAPRRARIRTMFKKVEAAIEAKDQKTASSALRLADKEGQRGATKGVFKKATISRRISRLSARIKKLAA